MNNRKLKKRLKGAFFYAEKEGFEPSEQFPVRMFSKHVLSATQAPLQLNI
jgi:hypothetical protein